ncbi:hypothetical protein GGF50DRAFT_121752 [Schizophyllum commune]
MAKTRTPSNSSHEEQHRADGELDSPSEIRGYSRINTIGERIGAAYIYQVTGCSLVPSPLIPKPPSTTFACFRRRPALDIRGPVLGAGRVGVAGRRGAERRCVGSALDGGKNRKSTSNAPRSAPELLADRRDTQCRRGGGGRRGDSGAERRCSRLLTDASKYFSRDLRVLRSHPLTVYPSRKLDEDASTSSLASSSRSRSISTHPRRISTLISLKADLEHLQSNGSSSGEQGSFSFARGPSPLHSLRPFIRPRSAPPFARTSPLQSQLRAPLQASPPPPATPSILVSNHYNSPRDAHARGSSTLSTGSEPP